LVLLDENKPLHERFRALFTLKNMGGDTAVKVKLSITIILMNYLNFNFN